MTTLELEADKARLAYAILSIDNASLPIIQVIIKRK